MEKININYDFLNLILLLISVIITFYIYSKNKKEDMKARATMLYFQIKEIEGNMQYIKNNCAKNNFIWSGEFHKSNLVYEHNLWSENKIYFVKRLSNDDYNAFEKFYSIATSMLNEQKLVKSLFKNNIEYRQKFSNEKQYEENYKIMESMKKEDKDIESKIQEKSKLVQDSLSYVASEYIPTISNDLVQQYASEFKQLTNTVAFEKIKKIAKIK